MADSAHTTNLSRRRALLGVSTGIAAASILGMTTGATVAGLPDHDGELFALWHEYLRLESEMLDAYDARDVVARDATQSCPTIPDCLSKGWVQVVVDGEIERPEY